MIVSFKFREKIVQANLSKPFSISIPLRNGMDNPNAFYAPPVQIWPVEAGDFIGDTQLGGPLNFKNVQYNPHGNGTHTECVGHIATEQYYLPDCLQENHFLTQVISVWPLLLDDGDKIITKSSIEGFIEDGVTSLVLRTLPNDSDKMMRQYSGNNPCYCDPILIEYLVSCGIEHLLIDLPSVDREEDEGALLAHKAFWNYPEEPRINATITELIYVPDEVKDGVYLVNIQTTKMMLDASPSHIVLYDLIED